MKDITLKKCEKCGKVVEVIGTWGCETLCCGSIMKTLEANSTDAATEKHVPVVTENNNLIEVVVGSTLHPMSEAHLIEFIYLVTDQRVIRVDLTHLDQPKATFSLLEGEKPLKVYEYCNLHGLWVKEL